MSDLSKSDKRKYRFNPYLLVPLLALIITVSLIWHNSFDKGRLIQLRMNDASGIEAGKTVVKFRSVIVGIVEEVSLSDDFSGAVAQIRMNPDTDELLNEDTMFWIEKPRVQYNSITGLDTILSGSYIQIYKGTSSNYSTDFICEKDVPIGLDENGVSIKLIGRIKKVINQGTQINYKGFNVGLIVGSSYDRKEDCVVYDALIKKEYLDLVTDKSVFWVDSGVDFSISPSGMNLNIPNIENLISGSINVDKFNNDKGMSIKNNDIFDLYGNIMEAKSNNLKNNPKVVVLFDKDIKNIKNGSNVYFRGLNVGQVVSFPWFENDYEVYELNKRIPALIIFDTVYHDNSTSDDFIRKLLSTNSLCASFDNSNLFSSGSSIKILTSQKCRDKTKLYRGVPVIPFVDQGNNLVNDLSVFANKLNKIDLIKVTDSLNSTLASIDNTLASIRKITDSVSSKGTVDKINSTLESYDENSKLYRSLLEISEKLNSSLNDLSPTIKKVGQQSNSLIFSSKETDIEPKVGDH
ncbi:MAG: intermembrane transport protein PqiB [Succinivibrio sp.]